MNTNKIKKDSASEGEYNDVSVQPSKYSGLVLEHQTLRHYRLSNSQSGASIWWRPPSLVCINELCRAFEITDYKLLFSGFEGIGFRERKIEQL